MLLLGSAWYTEKYRRDEAELEGQLRKLYFRDAQDSKERMPQMTAVIKGESMNLDPRMDKLVWGGKAQLKNNNNKPQNNHASSLSSDENDSDFATIGSSSNEEKKTRRKRKKRKPKKESGKEKLKAEEAVQLEKQQQRKLVLQSSVAGVAVGAVAVAAVTAILGGSKGRN